MSAGLFAVWASLSAALAQTSGATDAEGPSALEQLEGSIRVIPQRYILRRLRVELQATGGMGVEGGYNLQGVAAGDLRLHIDERWSVGLAYSHFFGDTSDLYETVVQDYELFPERSQLRWYTGLSVGFIPFEGKFAAFGEHVVHFDLFVSVGGGVLQTSRSDAFKPAGLVGVGGRLWLTRWLALTLEFRDHIYSESFNAGDRVLQEFVVLGGFSIFLPPSYDYRYPR